MGREDCHCSESKVPRIQAFAKIGDGKVLNGDHHSDNFTYVKLENITEHKCIDYEQDPETGTVFTIKKDGTYQVNYGGLFTFTTGDIFSQNLPKYIQFNFGAEIIVNGPPLLPGPRDGEFVYQSINPVINQGQIDAMVTGTQTITQNRSFLLKLKRGDKLRYIAGGFNDEFTTVLLLNANLSLERLQ